MQQLAEPDVPVLAVGFDPAPALAEVATALGRRGPFLVDADRVVYRRLDLRRAPWWRVWSPRTLLWYHRDAATPDGAGSALPTDVRQMGGDAVVVDGAVVTCWRPRTPVDRVDPGVLLAAARAQIEIM